jgi:hypothetical protein
MVRNVLYLCSLLSKETLLEILKLLVWLVLKNMMLPGRSVALLYVRNVVEQVSKRR